MVVALYYRGHLNRRREQRPSLPLWPSAGALEGSSTAVWLAKRPRADRLKGRKLGAKQGEPGSFVRGGRRWMEPNGGGNDCRRMG